ncbi:Protein FecR [Pseudomonas fluorescens]|uniref:DUF4880 domain-containing protein n=1 Tax=Pseudomonas fluorescens TaxID=294 RepID=UPI00125695B9|nr:DUF4880 domain-containing protein [Pseudomonas fluorescens]CAG8865625.1 Protein FecR [Pseudomonas fluorescens]
MNTSGERLPEDILCTAIEWQMRLRAHPGRTDLLEQVHSWRRGDARHELAWQRLEQVDAMFSAASLPDASQVLPVLRRAEADLSRRRTLKLLGLGLAAGGAGLLVTRLPAGWRNDFATATGERRRVDLANGAQVLLNTRSAVDIQGRDLVFRAGEVLVDGPDWRVRCPSAHCEGYHARAVLRERDGYSELHVERGAVRVSGAWGVRQVQAGSGISIDALGIERLEKGPLDPFAWSRGLLLASNMRLGDFLAEAGRYRQGWLGCDDRVTDLRLSGVFHLDAPELMLRNITHLLPVGIVERTRWWVRIVPLA